MNWHRLVLVPREIRISWRFIRRDLSTTMIPAALVTTLALRTRWPVALHEVLVVMAQSALYFWLYTYTFCLSNQIAGVEEDRLNKPDRPLPSGMVTSQGAKTRWWAHVALFLLVGWWLNVLGWTGLGVALSVLHNWGRWDRHWLTKNAVVMPLGTFAGHMAAWRFAAPINAEIVRWSITLCSWVAVTSSIQDFRDVEGDRALGRRTLPIVFGQTISRAAVGTALLLTPAAIHHLLATSHMRLLSTLYEVLLAALIFAVAARLWRLRTPEADDRTYNLYTYAYCVMLLSGFLIL
jgi:4-hydroxybenzoate polyprenyltransferase